MPSGGDTVARDGTQLSRILWRGSTVQDVDMAEAPSSELLVIAPSKPWRCTACTREFEWGDFLTMDDGGPVCLDCADLGHLEFVPRGNTALTRRARRASRLSAVVVQWSPARKRY